MKKVILDALAKNVFPVLEEKEFVRSEAAALHEVGEINFVRKISNGVKSLFANPSRSNTSSFGGK